VLSGLGFVGGEAKQIILIHLKNKNHKDSRHKHAHESQFPFDYSKEE